MCKRGGCGQAVDRLLEQITQLSGLGVSVSDTPSHCHGNTPAAEREVCPASDKAGFSFTHTHTRTHTPNHGQKYIYDTTYQHINTQPQTVCDKAFTLQTTGPLNTAVSELIISPLSVPEV